MIILGLLLSVNLRAQAPFAPGVGFPGSTAIAHDSSVIKAWATHCSVQQGYWDISRPSLGPVTYGDSTAAVGRADNQVVSLGDSGVATFSLLFPLSDAMGADFAIFENSFSDDYLELAFVEVSSNGQDYVRFPAVSYTQDTMQTSSFGSTDPRQVHNLAGKYRGFYGTPFDLAELKDSSSVDINLIRFIRVVDVVGSINPAYASYDVEGRIINDPFPTAFASGGFDLDALALLYPNSINLEEHQAMRTPFPNPARTWVRWEKQSGFTLVNSSGQLLRRSIGERLDLKGIAPGIYFLKGLHPPKAHQIRVY